MSVALGSETRAALGRGQLPAASSHHSGDVTDMTDVHLTPTQHLIMEALLHGRWVRIESLIDIVYGSKPDGDEPGCAYRVISATFCGMRKKLTLAGIETQAARQRGYRILPASLPVARSLFNYKACPICGSKSVTVRADDRPSC